MKTDELRPQTIELLYHQAFERFRTIALWNMQPVQHPSAGAALAITPALRQHGAMEGRKLAEEIERLCRASD